VHGTQLTDVAGMLHGWPGLLSAYASVQAPMIAGLLRRGAPLQKMLLSPLAAVPLTAVAGSAIAAATSAFSTLGFAGGGLLQLSAGAALTATLGYVTGCALARKATTPVTHLRGAIVTEPAPIAEDGRADIRRGRGTASHQTGGLTLAGLHIAEEDEAKHFKLIGTTGTGKSTAICEMLSAALQRGDRAVIADPDGGYLQRFYDPRRGDVILNPFDARSAKWDLFSEITNDYDVDQLSRSLIPDHEGSDRSWRGYARTFFSAVTSQAHAAGNREVGELYRLLVVAGTSELKTLVAGTPAQPFLEEHNGRMFDSIRSVTSSAVSALEYVSRQRNTPLSVRRWVQGSESVPQSGAAAERGVLFMPYRAGQVAALRSTISAWMRLAIFEAMNRDEGDRRLWFVVDELDALGQIDGLKDALARLRKFGGRCVLGFQSIAQVSSTYGSGEAQTIVENCGNTLILRCSGSEHGGTSQFASRLIGEREVTRITTSRSRRPGDLRPAVTRAEHLGVEAAVMGSEIEQLPDLTGYLKLASCPEWRRVRLRPPAQRRQMTTARHEAKIISFPGRLQSAPAAPHTAVAERSQQTEPLGFEPE
jgi:type IV secretory pathway TraG/TraD family ATPase VirD4